MGPLQVRDRQFRPGGRNAGGQQETEDLYASIGGVVDKLERQALKHKEKLAERKRRGRREAEPVAVETPRPARKKASARAAAPASSRIVRSARYRLKPLSAEDAVLELEASGEEILVYRDAETYRVNVVYRRRDGHFGLVDPEF